MKLAIFPEGPLAFDGKTVLYSEGEASYIESLAERFEEVIVLGYWFRPGSPWYSSVAHMRFSRPNVRFVELPLTESPSFLAKLWQMARVFWVILRHIGSFDMLYFFIPGYPSAIGYLLNLVFRKPYALYCASDWSAEESELIFRWHGSPLQYFFGFYTRINLWFERSMVRGAVFTLSASRKCIDRYRELSETVFKTVPRINWKSLSLYPREDTCQQRPIQLLYVGGLYERKGVRFLLDAVANVRQRHDVHLSVIGDGEDRAAFEAHAGALGISGIVTFVGHLPHGPALMERYKAADMFTFPSLGEGFPRVLYEAMMHGLPIVTTDVGGILLEVPDGERCLAVPPGRAADLQKAIERLIEDGDLRRRLIRDSLAFMGQAANETDGGIQFRRLLAQYGGPAGAPEVGMS